MISNVFNRVINDYKEVFKENIQNLDRDIITNSPVDSGRFKTAWQLREYDLDNFKFHRSNNIDYGLSLWRYKKSMQGWSPIGGDDMVKTHVDKLEEDFQQINNTIFNV